jgi:hypothetical protein
LRQRTPNATVAIAALLAGLSWFVGSAASAQSPIPTFDTTTTTSTEPTTTSTTSPTTTSTTRPSLTTTTIDPGTTTTTIDPGSTTTTAAPSTTAPPASSAPRPASTTTTDTTVPPFVPPPGVTSTTAAPVEEVLDADTSRLPVFVALSLLGFAGAVTILIVQWVRSRPASRRAPAGL